MKRKPTPVCQRSPVAASANRGAGSRIEVAAVAVVKNGHLLMVRKRGARTWILPGGKREAGELPETTVAREVDEELGCEMRGLKAFGEFVGPAAHDPGRDVVISLFVGDLVGRLRPSSEIVEYGWISLRRTGGLAPVHATINPALQDWYEAHSA